MTLKTRFDAANVLCIARQFFKMEWSICLSAAPFLSSLSRELKSNPSTFETPGNRQGRLQQSKHETAAGHPADYPC